MFGKALAIGVLTCAMVSSVQAKAIIKEPADSMTASHAIPTSTPAHPVTNPRLSVPETANAPIAPAVSHADGKQSEGTVRLAGWIDDVKSWIRERLQSAANWLRGGTRSVWEWALRVAAWARDNLGARTYVEYHSSNECTVHAVFTLPVYATCTVRADGSVSVEVYTR